VKKARGADEDAEHFARAMADVVRLAPDPRGRARSTRPLKPRPGAPPSPQTIVHEKDEDEDSHASFVAAGVDRRELRKLKRGEYAPSLRLDLHGQTGTEAVASVKHLLEHARHRCVCIVHGRGLHSPGSVGVVKTRVRAYLRRHPAVLAFADAPSSDGGAGAAYVLLRRVP
jgi:DNA-nicking Smr family endonuclease